MPAIVQRSFNGGQVSPGLFGRADQVRYSTGVRTLLNFIPLAAGPAANRPGTQYVMTGKNSVYARLVPFIYSTDQTYVLEWGSGFIRFIYQGSQVQTAAAAYSAVTNYVVGELVLDGGLTYYSLQAVNVGQTPASSPLYWSVLTGTILEIRTDIVSTTILRDMHIVQNADVLIVTHTSFAPKRLSRLAHTWWVLDTIPFIPALSGPTDIAVVRGAAGSKTLQYRVTAYDADSGEESLAGSETETAITFIDGATPVGVTATAHPYSTGDEVVAPNIYAGAVLHLAAGTYVITVTGANAFTFNGSAGAGGGSVAVDGTPSSYRQIASITSAGTGTSASPHVVSWTENATAEEYNIYRSENGIFGLIGVAEGGTFRDIGYDADLSDTFPTGENPFAASDDYPAFSAFYQQRLCFARTLNEPRTIWMSKPGLFYNFTRSSPLKDDDRIKFTLAGNQMDGVQSMTEVGGRLIILTGSGEYTLDGDVDGVVRPTAINLKQQGYSGASSLRPVVSGNNALYVTARGSEVRDFQYSLSNDAYEGRDLSIFSRKLVQGKSILEWAHAQSPFHVTWMCLDDFSMVGMVYLREQEVVAWFPADVSGNIFSLCVIPDGAEDVLYLYVIRAINGITVPTIERLHTRDFTSLRDAFFVDAGVTYDGRAIFPMRLTLTTGAGWTVTDTITATASYGTPFALADVGKVVVAQILDDDGAVTDEARLLITGFTSATVVTGTPYLDVPAALRVAFTYNWSLAIFSMDGLDHLEGETIAALVDGHCATATVVSGAITLDPAGSVIHAGLPITADFEPLDIEVIDQESRIGKQIIVKDITLMVENTTGLKVGRDAANLIEFKERDDESFDDAIDMTTGYLSQRITGKFTTSGRVLVRQSLPLPATILALVRRGEAGDR